MTATDPTTDRAEIVRALSLLIPPGETTEIRALEATTAQDRFPQTHSGYFDDAEAAADAVMQIKSAQGVYFTPNKLPRDLLSRASNRMRPAKKQPLTSDHDVIGRRWLLVDLDPVRVAGVSSTDAEHDAAHQNAIAIVETMALFYGWPQPVVASSGNGAHLMWAIELPADDAGLCNRVLMAMAKQFDDTRVKVDQTTFNPARIWKLYGTVAAKGDSTDERPHRVARIISAPDSIESLSLQQLESIADPAPVVEILASKNGYSNGHHQNSNGKAIDLAEWLSKFNISHGPAEDWRSRGGPATRFMLDVCPWNPAHTDDSAWVAQYQNGALAAGCSHNSCAGKKWEDLRAIYDPKKFNGVHRASAKPVVHDDQGNTAGDADRFTEQSNAKKLVSTYGELFRWNPDRSAYLHYEDETGRWLDDRTGVVERFTKSVAADFWCLVPAAAGAERKNLIKHATKSESAQGVSAVMKLARSEPGITVLSRQLDACIWSLNCRNGVLNPTTGQLLPHAPDRLITKLAPVQFDPEAECPTFIRFINRIMADNPEMINYLARVLGMALTGDVSMQELFVFFGSGANGKSVLVDTFASLMGDYAGQAPPALLTIKTNEEHPTEVADLQGRRLVFASETEEGAKLKIQLVKRLTGDGTLKARYMRGNYFEFPRTFKLILATNNKPRITENTNAVWRRLRLIPFSVVIPPDEQDPKLLEKLRGEWAGILAWAVRGCMDWHQHGMQTPAAVLQATNEYQSEQDVLGEYLAARCVLGEGRLRITRNELFNDYLSWAHQTGERFPLDRNSFFERVRRVAGIAEKSWKPVGQSAPVRGFTGIALAFNAQFNSESGDQ